MIYIYIYIIILNENTFINCVALSRFTQFRSISEENCGTEGNLDKVKKVIDIYTIYYAVVYFISIFMLIVGTTESLTIIFKMLLPALIVGVFVSYLGLKFKYFQVDRRLFTRDILDGVDPTDLRK